jgi:hypothetical protein
MKVAIPDNDCDQIECTAPSYLGLIQQGLWIVQLIWRDEMCVPSKCTIFRTVGRLVYALEVLCGGNRAQNGDRN